MALPMILLGVLIPGVLAEHSGAEIGATVVLLAHLFLTMRLHASWSRLPEIVRWLGLTAVTLAYNLGATTVMVFLSHA